MPVNRQLTPIETEFVDKLENEFHVMDCLKLDERNHGAD
jgi:hypothetical protein